MIIRFSMFTCIDYVIIFKCRRYIVIDPNVCHGEPTFRGTRVMVKHVLEQVIEGMSWDATLAQHCAIAPVTKRSGVRCSAGVVQEWRGSVTKDAIAEAVQLASKAFLEHAPEYVAHEYVLQRVPA